MWYFSRVYLISLGWECTRELWSICLGMGVLDELIFLILSESYQFPSLYYRILDNLCNLLCFSILTCSMGRITFYLIKFLWGSNEIMFLKALWKVWSVMWVEESISTAISDLEPWGFSEPTEPSDLGVCVLMLMKEVEWYLQLWFI